MKHMPMYSQISHRLSDTVEIYFSISNMVHVHTSCLLHTLIVYSLNVKKSPILIIARAQLLSSVKTRVR